MLYQSNVVFSILSLDMQVLLLPYLYGLWDLINPQKENIHVSFLLHGMHPIDRNRFKMACNVGQPKICITLFILWMWFWYLFKNIQVSCICQSKRHIICFIEFWWTGRRLGVFHEVKEHQILTLLYQECIQRNPWTREIARANQFRAN